MKIGFDAKRYFVNLTGLGNYSRTLVENLVRYHPENQYQLYSYKPCPHPTGFPLSEPGVSVHTPVSGLGKLNGALWRSFFIKSDLVRGEPEIYHGLSHELPVGISNIKGIRSVVTIHDLIFLQCPEFYRFFERSIYLRKFRYACRNADRIITVSDQTKEDVIRYFGTPAERIETVYQSCDPTFSRIVDEDERRSVTTKYGLPEAYVLYVGAFNTRKNLVGLVEAMNLMGKGLDIPLVLVGGGDKYKALVQKRIQDLGLTERVWIRSGIPNEDLPAVYQSAKLFVYPSFYEGFGIPIIEAMSGRVPVVTSRGGCFPEAGGPDSLYVDPGSPEELASAMERVLTDSSLAERMIEKGVEYVDRFQGQKIAGNLVRLYNDLVK